MEYSKEELEKMLQNPQMSSAELEALLKAREEGKIDFVLMDVREVFEFTDRSIHGTDMLLPTSMMNNKMEVFEELKEKPVVLYCRTGSRTGQVMYVLRKMGYDNIVHLNPGIMGYRGDTERNAPLPNEL
ncbi:MAG TPA: rhodanese-like domain-containing protein [Campylobacteraceae bacterium]|nr:rhodanese-like domain-containing protein [Campylobacteraceae bacterium]